MIKSSPSIDQGNVITGVNEFIKVIVSMLT